MLGVPLAGGGAGTESLLAQAVAAASERGLVQPGSHVVAAMSYRGDLVLQARPGVRIGFRDYAAASPITPPMSHCGDLVLQARIGVIVRD